MSLVGYPFDQKDVDIFYFVLDGFIESNCFSMMSQNLYFLLYLGGTEL